MKKALRILLLSLAMILVLLVSLFAYFVYTPAPEQPKLSGELIKATIDVGGETYTYRLYQPKDLPKGAPLVVVLHGSGQNGAQIRIDTGYGFERLADQHQFGVVYPSGKSFDWNDCSKTGDFQVNGRELDEVLHINTLVDTLIAAYGFDQRRVFATGVSAGGFMSFRLALESPERFRAVAAVSANLPAPENFKCKPVTAGASVMILNGTQDTIVPYAGGKAELWGMFFQNGQVLSSEKSAEYFVEHNNMAMSTKREVPFAAAKNVQRLQWRDESRLEVELITIVDGGHGMPQPYWQRPRILGPSPMEPNGPELIWEFFARQKP